MTTMRPRTALAIALLVVGTVALPGVGAAAVERGGSSMLGSDVPSIGTGDAPADHADGSAPTAPQAADGNESETADSAGAILSATVGAEESTLDAEVRTGTFEYHLASVEPAARGKVLAEMAAELDTSLSRIGERIDAANATTDPSRQRYLASRAAVERASIERLADSGARLVDAFADEQWAGDLQGRFRRVGNDSRDVEVPDRFAAPAHDLPSEPVDAPFVIGPASNTTRADFEEYFLDGRSQLDELDVATPTPSGPTSETPTPPEMPTPTTPTPSDYWDEEYETPTEWELNETDS